MSRHGRPPGVVGPQRVPDSIFGSKKVSRRRTGETIQLPGGREAELILEVTQDVCHTAETCETGCYETVQRAPHLDASWEGIYTHGQELLTLDTGPDEGGFATPLAVDGAFFRVPNGRTLFIEKLILKPFDAGFETLQYVLLQDGAPALAPFSLDAVLLPTYPQFQRNVRWEIAPNHTVGIRAINNAACQRRVWVGWVGWMESMRCSEIRNRT